MKLNLKENGRLKIEVRKSVKSGKKKTMQKNLSSPHFYNGFWNKKL
jgi:hypothetical protein